MSSDQELMRQFLIILSKGKPGEEIKLHIDTLDAVDENLRISFKRDGPLMVMSAEVVKDEWGRIVDRCGQVKCLNCDVRINYDYPDGSKREYCARHET
jgi:hypothetical protein